MNQETVHLFSHSIHDNYLARNQLTLIDNFLGELFLFLSFFCPSVPCPGRVQAWPCISAPLTHMHKTLFHYTIAGTSLLQ